jgi:transcriptional regulator GlxA family with amidase domain
MVRKRVGILVFAEVEVLDFCGPFEVFSATRLDESRRRQEPSPFEVILVAETIEAVIATGGLKVLPDHDLQSCPPLDLVVIPGGWGTRHLVQNDTVVRWIQDQAQQVELATSVCTGSFLLGQAGLLDGRRATTHWSSLDRMEDTFPAVHVVRDQRVVEDGSVVTSAGIAAGIDLALRIVARYHGKAIGRATARHMEYPYPEKNDRDLSPLVDE